MHASLETFPVAANIDPCEIAKIVTEYFESNDSDDLSDKSLFKTCFSTIMWLAQEEFIIIKQSLVSGECSVVLTQKGLNALNSVPAFAESEKKSFGQYFIDGIKTIPFTVVSSLMTDFFK